MSKLRRLERKELLFSILALLLFLVVGAFLVREACLASSPEWVPPRRPAWPDAPPSGRPFETPLARPMTFITPARRPPPRQLPAPRPSAQDRGPGASRSRTNDRPRAPAGRRRGSPRARPACPCRADDPWRAARRG